MAGHRIERRGTRDYRCAACGWTWTREPVSSCPGVPRYAWWNTVPPHLKTATQLRQASLKPAGAIRGCVASARTWAGETWYWLYDVAEARPRRRVSEAQRAALAAARAAKERKAGEILQRAIEAQEEAARERVRRRKERRALTRERVALWAAALRARDDWRVIDCETTGLEPGSEIVSVAIVAPDGAVLLDTLIRPQGCISQEASAVNGLTTADVAGAPVFPQVYPEITHLLAERQVLAFNADFDRSMLYGECQRHGLPWIETVTWEDAMSPYSEWMGQWSAYWGHYTLQPLPRAAGAHEAAADCLAVLALLDRLAADLPAARAAATAIHARMEREERERQRRAEADDLPF